jgi:hypothetical protein
MQSYKLYEIRVQGHIEASWSSWFDGLSLHHEGNGDTVLRGTIVDQAALHGVLGRIRDLGLPLVSVRRVTSDPACGSIKHTSLPSTS